MEKPIFSDGREGKLKWKIYTLGPSSYFIHFTFSICVELKEEIVLQVVMY